ncbi:protein bunched, class 2/F/G isoform isoform X2 [Plutella xylostella]|uniref:protein bunched, class 2/F/G isoform isoform X2 n=1 Tax=Plutella xylostella TaxID=51655 RepID=UPI0020324D0B|nr:protein bunched, class 2/F/G isoform isoform X2 [Plutella xylostella]
MADNLVQKSHKNSEKNKYNNVVHRTTSESLRLNESEKGVTHPTSLQAAHNPRKISSFQITSVSVTVGSRVSTDAGEDSADDLDESHTDDISRVTDIENETPSYSEDTFSKDDVFYNASSTSLGCAPVIPTSSQYGLAIVGQDNPPNQIGGAVPNSNSTEVNDMHVSVTNAGSGSIINIIGNAKPQEGMKEIQEHVRNERFKVVKIESTEPFRRGRWMCMDYLDHTTTQQSAPITLNNNLDGTETNAIQAPDSGVVITDCQHDDVPNDLNNKGPKDIQGNPTVQHIEQNVQKQFPMASPGQSLTQPLNVVQLQQQQIPVNQPVNVQSPPLEMPQQMQGQSLQANQQVTQQHPQSMTHITMQNAPQNHPQQPQQQQQQVQQIPQSFPQHQLQQVIAQSQGMAMQQIPMHQQMTQQMQQIPNQQMQQMGQHMPQTQMANMQQMQQQMPQMQGMTNQGQMSQVPNQQPQLQQMQIQQMQGQPNPQQMHPMQQTQMGNMGQGHHMQGQQAMGPQQPQLQHMPSQAQIQALQNQQIPNHIQQMQIPTQMAGTNQQIQQIQPQMHQLPSQPQQSVVPGMHQMQQQGMSGVQPQYNQAVSQQSNNQSMINASMPPSQQMVQPQHNVPQYHTQQSQMSQQGQTLPQEVLSSIANSQQGQTLPSNIQTMTSQPQGSTLPANLQSLSNQQQAPVHPMSSQQGNVPQGNMQMMNTAPQNMQMTLDGNQPSMQIPASDPIYMQQPNVGQQMPVQQHMTQQNMMPQQVGGGQGQMYVPNQPVPQVSMTHQMSMQQNMPVGMGGGVHPNVVQSQTSMGMGYGGVVPVMSVSQSSVAPVEATVSGTNSPVVSLPVSSTAYVGNTGQPGHDSQGFGSPVSAVMSHAVSGTVMSNASVCDNGAQDVPPSDALQAADIGDGKDETQPPQTEDESASGTSAVAIDNKIEQAMDLVKSHLMFAVREEVEVLKERIAELMERINQLEVENTYLRAHASQDTLAAMPGAGAKPPPAPQGPPPPVS